MLQKSKITGRFYCIESLSESELIDLGFTDELKNKLDKVPVQKKTSRVVKEKDAKKKKKAD
jgi:hypothetical protein